MTKPIINTVRNFIEKTTLSKVAELDVLDNLEQYKGKWRNVFFHRSGRVTVGSLLFEQRSDAELLAHIDRERFNAGMIAEGRHELLISHAMQIPAAL